MPQVIEIPREGLVEFPDSMSDDEIRSVIKRKLYGFKEIESGATIRPPAQPFSPTGHQSTTTGGPTVSVPEGAMRQTMADIGEQVGAVATSKGIELPRLTINKDDAPATVVGKEAVNLAIGIPEFFTSSLGITSAAAGAVAPTAVAAIFTTDMLRSLGNQILYTVKNWKDLDRNQRLVALTDIGGTGGLSWLLGRSTAKGLRRAVTPKVEPTAPATGEVLRTPKGVGLPYGTEHSKQVLTSPEEVASIVSERMRAGKATFLRVSNPSLDLQNVTFKSKIQKSIPDATHESGMSALTLWTPDAQLAKVTPRNAELGSAEHIAEQFSNFSHLIPDKPGVHAWLLEGDIVGLGYDGEPLLANVRKVADVDNKVSAALYESWAKSTGNPELIQQVSEKANAIRIAGLPRGRTQSPVLTAVLDQIKQTAEVAPMTAEAVAEMVKPTEAKPAEVPSAGSIPKSEGQLPEAGQVPEVSQEVRRDVVERASQEQEPVAAREEGAKEVAGAKPERDWELLLEDLTDELDSFNPARSTGRLNYELNDMAERFVEFAKNNPEGGNLLEQFKRFSATDEASKSQLKKLRDSIKSIEARESAGTKGAAPAPEAKPAESAVAPAAPNEAAKSKEPWEMTAEEAVQVTGLTWDKWQDAVRDAEKSGKMDASAPSSLSAAKVGYQDWRELKSDAQTRQKQPSHTSPIDTLNTAKQVRLDVPQGTTKLRLTDSKGRKSELWLADFKKSNPALGADIVKIEAGTVEKGGKFKAIKGEVGVADASKPISEGPGAASPGDVPQAAQIEQLTEQFKNISKTKAPLGERIKQAFQLGKQKELSQNLIARTLSALKSAGDYVINTYRGTMELDPVLRVKGELSADLESRGWRMRQAMKEMQKAVPDLKTREAISKFVDVGGDMEKLREAAETVPAGRRAAYERAMNLSAEEKAVANHITSFFEARLKEAQEAGIVGEGVADYIHRIYPRDTEWRRGTINAIQNGILDTRTPSLARKRVFEFDAEAEKAGYKPIGDFIPRILEYEASLSKAIASRAAVKKFVEIKMPDGRPMLDVAGIGNKVENAEGVREATLIKPSFKPGERQLGEDGKPTKNYRLDYQSRDYPALRKWKWATADENGNPIFVQGDVLIHPEAVHRIDALLEPSKLRKYGAVRGAMAVSSTMKQTMLDFSGFHQVQIAIHGMEHKVNPFNLIKDIDTTDPRIEGLLKGGLTLGGEHVSGLYREGLVGRSLSRQVPGLGPLMATYHNWLFQDFIPRVKTTMALHALERNRARFAKELQSGRMTEEALNFQTAKEANAAFGELNYVMLERSKTMQDLARLTLLAPDFLEARARFALQAGTKLGGEQRMALFLGAAFMYTTARIMNKLLDDEYHWEPENAFSVVYKGHAYSVRTVQGDLLHLVEEPVRFWLHRLNPTLTRPMAELMTQRDEFGRKRTFWQVMGDTVANAIPISMRSSREQKLWVSLLNSIGGSVRRYSDITRTYREAADWRKKNNKNVEPGEFIYDPDKDPYRSLKLALLDGDTGGAAVEYNKLIASKQRTPAQVAAHFKRYSTAPFAGSFKNDREFKASLSSEMKKVYEGAKQEKKRIYQQFKKARALATAPPQ